MAVTVKGKGKHVSRARRHFRLRKKVASAPASSSPDPIGT